MRISGGRLKGQKIKVPKGIKPAKNMVRLAVLDILEDKIKGAQILDLFAGSGSYGIEALSRGAKKAVFVDKDTRAVRTIKENLNLLGLREQGKATKAGAKGFARTSKEKFDLIFCSPPYRMGIPRPLLSRLPHLLQKKGIIIFEHGKETKAPEAASFRLLDQRTYGRTKISFFVLK